MTAFTLQQWVEVNATEIVLALKPRIFTTWPFGFPRWLSVKESVYQYRSRRRHQFNPWVGKIPWRRKRQPTPVFLPRKPQGQRKLVATVARVTKSWRLLSG